MGRREPVVSSKWERMTENVNCLERSSPEPTILFKVGADLSLESLDSVNVPVSAKGEPILLCYLMF